jgi:transposase
MNSKDFRSLSPKNQEEIRRKVVQAVINDQTRKEVALQFGLSEKSVGKWVKRFKQNGPNASIGKQRGRPRTGSLSRYYSMRFAGYLMNNLPEDHGIPIPIWTRQAIGYLFLTYLGFQFSSWTVGRHLERWGFRPQKPLQRSYEQNSRFVRSWLDKEYPRLHKKAKRESARIYWGSETWLRPDRIIGQLYGLEGDDLDFFVDRNPLHGRMVSATTNRGELCFLVYDESYCSEVVIDFMQRLVRKTAKKIYLIVDDHPAHRTRIVKRWLKENNDRIHLISPT